MAAGGGISMAEGGGLSMAPGAGRGWLLAGPVDGSRRRRVDDARPPARYDDNVALPASQGGSPTAGIAMPCFGLDYH